MFIIIWCSVPWILLAVCCSVGSWIGNNIATNWDLTLLTWISDIPQIPNFTISRNPVIPGIHIGYVLDELLFQTINVLHKTICQHPVACLLAFCNKYFRQLLSCCQVDWSMFYLWHGNMEVKIHRGGDPLTGYDQCGTVKWRNMKYV